MSELIHETPLSFSPQLAATIGLEEAILLQCLHEAASFMSEKPYQLSAQALQEKLCFWQTHDIQRVLKSLADKGVIQILSPPLGQSPVLSFLLSPGTGEQPARQTAPSAPAKGGANRISPYWKPSQATYQRLAQHSIPTQFANRCITEFVAYWQDRNELSHSWDAKFIERVMQKWQREQNDTLFQKTSDTPEAMQAHWQPSADALEILHRIGISPDFIEDAIPEFILYWREKGSATNTWNSKFIQHIKRQWARYTSALKHDTEPKRIDPNWQPDAEVFEILAMANIDEQFARQCISEFVLYWKESNQLYSSWNTKFLQHVKYRWANQHQLEGLIHAGQQVSTGAGAEGTGSFIAKHTDRSWADGL